MLLLWLKNGSKIHMSIEGKRDARIGVALSRGELLVGKN